MKGDAKLQFHAIFRPEPEGGFTVIVPSLPGCVTYGKTLKEANKMALDAIQGYLASVAKRQEKIVSDEGDFIGTINVSSDILKPLAYA
jgi:predicted RNase H-like HicB family nuclease